MDAFITGVVAGFGIAIPVGAIAILIFEIGIRRGLQPAFFAGAGAATADFLYAVLAVFGGSVLASAVESIGSPLRIVSALVLAVIALAGLARVRRQIEPAPNNPSTGDLSRTYARILGLTLVNPTTVVYFAAVVIGLGIAEGMNAGDGALFVIGAFLASLSWQTVLAAAGALAGKRLPAGARTLVSVLGNGLILVFAVVILSS
ncbi:MAG: LysE family transporter [Acidimicrobiia bacterium]